MLSMQEISDRLEIHDLLARYCYAIDDRDYDALDQVFTPDAVIDYTAVGGPRGSLQEIKAFLRHALARFPAFQHMCATTKLDLKSDEAGSRTVVFNPMVLPQGSGNRTVFIGLWYRDRLVRTIDGWRIAERVEVASWSHNAPPGMLPG